MVTAMDRGIAELADAGFDLAHAFDAREAALVPGWELLASGPPVGLLVGNTRALWPRFVAAMRDPALAAEHDPLERYTERSLAAAFPGAPIHYGHRRYAGAFLPFQRLAVAIGLGALAANQLVIHPIYGPWFALRGVITTEGAPPVRAPIAKPCTCTASCDSALTTAVASSRWQDWLAVRDACSLRAWRYSDDQLRYHYTKVWAPPDEGPSSP